MESKYDKANPVSNDESENSSFFVKQIGTLIYQKGISMFQ